MLIVKAPTAPVAAPTDGIRDLVAVWRFDALVKSLFCILGKIGSSFLSKICNHSDALTQKNDGSYWISRASCYL